jgi:hypothetical protein
MKTAMQELIEKLNNVKPTEFCSIETIKRWAESMLEKEKEQMCDFVEYCEIEHSKYQETEASWIKELTIDDLFEKRYTK